MMLPMTARASPTEPARKKMREKAKSRKVTGICTSFTPSDCRSMCRSLEAFRRSGWIIAYTYAGNALYKEDPDKFEELRKNVPESVIRELRENNEFWDTHMTEAAEVQDKVNDAYLKSNGLEDGVESYGKVLTLMLIWYKTADLSGI